MNVLLCVGNGRDYKQKLSSTESTYNMPWPYKIREDSEISAWAEVDMDITDMMRDKAMKLVWKCENIARRELWNKESPPPKKKELAANNKK